MSFDLSGRAAVVFGAADRLGRCLALALAEAGADVAVTSITKHGDEQLEVARLHDEIRDLGRRSIALSLDVTNARDVDETIGTAAADLGGFHLAVNNVDLVYARPATDVTDQEWSRVLAVNLTGVFLLCRAQGASFLSRGGGKIVNVVSLLAERGMANSAAYCAAKAGVLNLTRSLSAEWARSEITVTGLGVGFLEGSAWTEDAPNRHALERYLPMRRIGQPEEVAPGIVYLASDESAFMTGQTLWLEGGAFSHI